MNTNLTSDQFFPGDENPIECFFLTQSVVSGFQAYTRRLLLITYLLLTVVAIVCGCDSGCITHWFRITGPKPQSAFSFSQHFLLFKTAFSLKR